MKLYFNSIRDNLCFAATNYQYAKIVNIFILAEIFLIFLAQKQFGHVFDMLCVREHIDRLDAADVVFCTKHLQVASLCGGVAADVYDAWGFDGK